MINIHEKDISIPDDKKKYDLTKIDEKNVSNIFKVKLIKNIGYGGFGIVKLVQREKDKKYFALKIVSEIMFFIIKIIMFLIN